MIDTNDGEIWSDVFLSVNNWKEYRSDSVKYLECETSSSIVKDMEAAYVKDAVSCLKKAGWTVESSNTQQETCRQPCKKCPC